VESINDIRADLKNKTLSLEERMSKNEAETSMLQNIIGSIKGLCQQASEALGRLMSTSREDELGDGLYNAWSFSYGAFGHPGFSRSGTISLVAPFP
jgi:hypothetical protein